MGLPRNSAGYLVYIPSTGAILVSSDIVFDEDFISTVVYQDPCLPGGMAMQPPSLPPPDLDQEIHQTEDPSLVAMPDSLSSTQEPFLKNITKPNEVEEYFTDNLLPLVEGESTQTSQNFHDSQDSTADNQSQTLRRSERLKSIKQVYQASFARDSAFEQTYSELRQALAASLDDLHDMKAADFLPEPAHWKQILRLPERQKKHWLKALYKEIKLLIVTMKCFIKETPQENEPIIPVTAKF